MVNALYPTKGEKSNHIYILESREQAGFHSGSYCTDHIDAFRITVGQCLGFKCELYPFFMDLQKIFDKIREYAIFYQVWRNQ